MKFVIAALAAILMTAAHAETWYFIDGLPTATTLDHECHLLADGDTPQRILERQYGPKGVTKTKDAFLLGDRSHIQMWEHGKYKFPFVSSLQGCIRSLPAIRDMLAQDHPEIMKNVSSTTNNDPVWYVASGDTMQCIPMPRSLLRQGEQMWQEKGYPPVHKVTESGAESVTIFQGGSHVFMAYQSETDCRAWLPVSARLDAEARNE